MRSRADEERFADLRRRLALSVRRVCPFWLVSHADDIVQTAMVRILEASRNRGEGNPDLSALYLEKAALSATLDAIRRRRRKPESPDDDPNRTAAPEGSDPETKALSREIASGIWRCLGRLPEARRLPVMLHLQGHSVTEAASILEWEFKRTENLVYRGLADLRRCLKESGLAP